jgi:hypothetical protein
MDKTIITDIESSNMSPLAILCHGRGGNAELFIYAYQAFRDKKHLSLAEKIAFNILEFHKKHGYYLTGYTAKSDKPREDRSLFMGIAGVGYFLLRLTAPDQVPSILAPVMNNCINPGKSVSKSDYPFITISLPDMQRRLLQKDFERTLLISGKILPQNLNTFLNEHQLSDDKSQSLVKSFQSFIEKAVPSLPPDENEILKDIFQLELEKQQMDENVISHSRLSIKEKVLVEQAATFIEMDNDAFRKLSFHIDEDVRLATPDWNWNESNRDHWISNLYKEKGEEEEEFLPTLFKATPLKTMEFPLSPFSYTILYEFQEANPVEQVIRSVLEAFESLTPEQEKMLKEKIIKQIKEALSAGILIGPTSGGERAF